MLAESFLNRVEGYLEAQAQNNWSRFVGDEGVDIDRNHLLYEATAQIFETEENEGDFDRIVDVMEQLPVVDRMFRQMEITIEECLEDAIAYHNAQQRGIYGVLNYHGMSVNDFI